MAMIRADTRGAARRAPEPTRPCRRCYGGRPRARQPGSTTGWRGRATTPTD